MNNVQLNVQLTVQRKKPCSPLCQNIATLCAWRKTWRFQREVVPASAKPLETWSAAEKFTVMLEITERIPGVVRLAGEFELVDLE